MRIVVRAVLILALGGLMVLGVNAASSDGTREPTVRAKRSAKQVCARHRARAVRRRCMRRVRRARRRARLRALRTPVGPRLFGFNDNSVLMGQVDPEAAIERSARVGANVVRYTVNWDYVEPRRGQWNWRGYDPLYEAALRHGIRPILIPAFSPGWTRPLDLDCGADIDHCHNPPDRKFDAAWVEFIDQLVARYPKAAAIEVWNEPNLIQFWRGGPDAARYVELLDLAYRTVKARQPALPVLGGALSNTQWGGDGSVPYEDYLSDMLARRPVMDALALHDYDSSGEDGWFDKTLDIARAALDAHGYSGMRLWVTEVGRSTGGDEPVTPEQQAERLAEILRELGARDDVEAALVHTLVPAPVQAWTEEYGFATLNPDGSAKPAYCALAVARRVPAPHGCTR